MQNLVIRWAINALALYLAVGTGWIPGVQAEETSAVAMLALALIFGLANALIRPILKLLTCPLILVTLGLFTLVINTGMLVLTGWIGRQFGVGITFAEPFFWNGFWAAFLAGLLITVVSAVLTMLLREELER
ncbi:MAG: phage holin family protein [Anaerolineales bacterium]